MCIVYKNMMMIQSMESSQIQLWHETLKGD